METIVAPIIGSEQQIDRGYSVLVYDDNVHTKQFVSSVLSSVIKISLEEAFVLVREIEENGKTIVCGPMSKPEAELIYKKLAFCGDEKIMLHFGIKSGGLNAELVKN